MGRTPHIELLLLVSQALGILFLTDDGCIAVQLVVPCCLRAALQLRQSLCYTLSSYTDLLRLSLPTRLETC